MKRRHGKLPGYTLAVVATIAILLFYIEERNKVTRDDPHLMEKLQAATITQRAFEIIKSLRDSLELPIDVINDPNATGLIGDQYTPITYGMGNLTEKLTTLNPNFAAAIVDMFIQAGLKENDIIAVGWSGCYPAINIAVLAACKVLKLHPIIVTSVAASMWGATIPDLTWLDMETTLWEAGIFPYRSVAASIGGKNDVGMGLSPEGRKLILEAIQRNNVRLMEARSLQEAVNERLAIYGDSVKLFVNVGWSPANIGGTETDLQPGLILRTQMLRLKGTSVAKAIAERGVPIVNLVEFEKLAHKYGLPIAPIPLPPVGEGKLYHKTVYSVPLASVFIVIIIAILIVVVTFDVEHIIRRQ